MEGFLLQASLRIPRPSLLRWWFFLSCTPRRALFVFVFVNRGRPAPLHTVLPSAFGCIV